MILQKRKFDTPAAVVIGKFDGVHKGHQKLMSLALEICKKDSLTPLAYTFPNNGESIITDNKKTEIFEKFGFENIYYQSFTEEFKCTSPEEFIHILKDELCAAHIIIGFNFRFGKDRCGDADTMVELCNKNNIGITVAPPVIFENEPISSTRIRADIKSGNVKNALFMMGEPFEITGKVVSGKKLGREMGFPTINMSTKDLSIIPENGVYATYVELDKEYPAITNIGANPTVEIGSPVKAETHIIGFDGDLYGKFITVKFSDKLRNEQVFKSIDALISQLENDKLKSVEIFKNRR